MENDLIGCNAIECQCNTGAIINIGCIPSLITETEFPLFALCS